MTLRREEAEATVRNGIQVEAVDGTVTLKGTVYSWEERNAAIDAACAAPGVIGVDDQLVVAG